MKTTVFFFHPNRSASRTNAVLAQAATDAGVEVRDLYALYPDGKVDVAVEQAALEAADRIVLQFPMYWYSTPSLLKQWQDDVLTYGWAYGSTGTALHGKELLVAASSGSPSEKYQVDGDYHYTAFELLRPLQATSNLIGTTYVEPFVTAGAMTITDEELAAQASKYAAILTAPRAELAPRG